VASIATTGWMAVIAFLLKIDNSELNLRGICKFIKKGLSCRGIIG